MDELVFLGLISLLWLVVVPIIVLVKLSGLKIKVREQEEYLQWQVSKLEKRLTRLESGLPAQADAQPAPKPAQEIAQELVQEIAQETAAVAEKPEAMPPETAPIEPAQIQPEAVLPSLDSLTAAYAETVSTAKAPAPLPEKREIPAQASGQVLAEAQLPQVSDPIADAFKWAQGLIRKSNMWVLGGTILLLFGLVFLAKLAIDAGWYTPSLRLASGALLGLALLSFGWRSRESKPQLGQIMQGGGVAAFYLVVIAAVKLHNMLPAAVGLPLLLLLVALGSILAVLQNATWLAHVSMVSGFLAPVLLSDGSGNYVALFSVYIALNLGIMLITRFRPWPHLCLTGFILTYGIGGLWGVRSFEPDFWTTVEPFLLVFTLSYLWLAWQMRKAAVAESNMDDAAESMSLARKIFNAKHTHYFLALATPAVFLIYQLTVVGHLPFAMALSGLGLGFIYLLGAQRIWKSNDALRQIDAQIYFTLAVTGLNLALLFGGLDTGFARNAMLFYLGVVWVVEGSLFIFITRHNQPVITRYTRALGFALMLVGSVLSFVYGAEYVSSTAWDTGLGDSGGDSLWGGLGGLRIHLLAGTLLAAASALAAAWGCRGEASGTSRFEIISRMSANPPVHAGTYLLAAFWLLLGLYWSFELMPNNLTWSTASLSAIVCLSMLLRARLDWPELRCLLALPLVYALPALVYSIRTIAEVIVATDHYELTYMALLWDQFIHMLTPLLLACLPFALDWLVSRREQNRISETGKLLLPALGYAAALVCLPTVLSATVSASTAQGIADAWFMDLPLVFSLLAIAASIFTAKAYGPANQTLGNCARAAAWWICAALPFIHLLIWQVFALFSPAWAEPLPYIPLLNPLDLGAIFICLTLWLWREKTRGLEQNRAVDFVTGLPGLAIICGMAFLAGHGIILRAVAGMLFDAMYIDSIIMEPVAQVSITLYWGVCGFTLMLLGSKRALRLVWICGALLLLAAALKAVLIDTRNVATFARVAVYFGIGVLFICAGYFIPVPGGKNRNSAARPEQE